MGSHDNVIDVYNTDKFDKKCSFKNISSYITHLDWSEDSQTLHSNDGSYELLYWDINTKSQDSHGASNFRDEKWASWSCILGWTVQGIFPPHSDGTDINGVDRSRGPHPDGYELVATADDFSKVKVFRYPSMVEDSSYIEKGGHSSHVTNVKFTNDDKHLISIGGNDMSVFQWRIQM